MKQSLTWLWLIGSVLYAVSVWFSADAVNVGRQTSAPAVTESPESKQIVEAQTEPIAPQPLPDAGSSSRSAFSEQPSEKAEVPSASTAAPPERLVVRHSQRAVIEEYAAWNGACRCRIGGGRARGSLGSFC